MNIPNDTRNVFRLKKRIQSETNRTSNPQNPSANAPILPSDPKPDAGVTVKATITQGLKWIVIESRCRGWISHWTTERIFRRFDLGDF